MKILLLLPYSIDSHLSWARGLQRHSKHEIEIMGLSGSHWKWRMHGGAVSLARKFLKLERKPDLVVATDMLDLSTFLGLVRKEAKGMPFLYYLHENQLTYPWSESDADVKKGRDRHYAWINYVSALAADKVLFNSHFHQEEFLKALPSFLKAFPDHQELDTVDLIRQKSKTLPVGLDFFDHSPSLSKVKNEKPLILWNHRWEYDKNPEAFFEALKKLSTEGLEFDLVVLGKSFGRMPKVFEQAHRELSKHILHWGFAENRELYQTWLQKADLLPVTSQHDFFGLSVLEAVHAETYPLLPNRLAYPEHISPAQYPEHYYSNQQELEKKLRDWLKNPKSFPSSLKNSLKRYGWDRIAPLYDELFEGMRR